MSCLLLGEKGCGYRFYRDTEWDISADMKNIFLSYRGATAELIRILTVKFKIPGDTDNVFPLNPHPREKKKRSFPPRCCYRCSALRNPTRLFFYLAFTHKTGSGRRRRKMKIKDRRWEELVLRRQVWDGYPQQQRQQQQLLLLPPSAEHPKGRPYLTHSRSLYSCSPTGRRKKKSARGGGGS